jgi:hypothetical protein
VCLVSTGAWDEISGKGWYIRAIWYSGIVFALFSVLTATQQTLRLHRLSAHKDGLHLLRLCLVRDRKPLDSEDGEAKLVPKPFQVWSWQSSMMFLMMAVGCLLVGMLVLVWSAVVKDTENVEYDENIKVSVCGVVWRGVLIWIACDYVYDGAVGDFSVLLCDAGQPYGWSEHRLRATWMRVGGKSLVSPSEARQVLYSDCYSMFPQL